MEPQYAYQSAPANFMPMMAGGGLAAAAQHLQGQGRGGDSMLVHMTPGEVKGLQSLAMAQGGSLTINPTTGLPEANVLKRFLPMILGAGLTIASGGALSPLMAAGLVGAGYGVAKGSLKEGLMAGLGAYGGAGLTAGLTSAAAASPAATAANLGVQGAATGAGSQSAMLAAQNAGFGQAGLEATRQAAATAAGAAVPSATTSALMTPIQGGSALTTAAGREAFKSALPKYAGTAATMAGLGAISEQPKPLEKPEYNYRPYEFAWNPQENAYSPMPSPGDSSERLYFNPTFTPLPIQRAAQGGQIANPFDEMTEDGGYAAGGLSNILPPRFLSGGGDGMSDSIKANIDGKQEARLADGEFVVPADVVSHLGNGSSKAGAKKLYSMMDRIRKDRTGKTRQAPEVNALKYMPA